MKDVIAIVGTACRLPGGIANLADLHSALSAGRDLVTEAPPDRFDKTAFLDLNPRRPGKTYTFAGGFLDDVAGFDAGYFGISPREASRMDPQQRLLLELAVEGMDDAAIDPAGLAGSDTGVYVGVATASYGQLQQSKVDTVDAYTVSGNTTSNTANRISRLFDLRGPSMAVNTACSSALVACHQACEALRSGEIDLALVGGVHLLLNPKDFVALAKASVLSPTGRCRAFSAEADGYARAEGGAVVVLKRLADALASGDRVHAVVLGTGINSDGRTPGPALPSVQAQESLLRSVYERFDVDPDELVYLEAHGTGSRVGDAIECEAIGRAIGKQRTVAAALPIGSVKTNLGHLEAASGLVGLLKAVLVAREREIPASLHATPLNPEIDFAGTGLVPALRPQRVEPGRRAVVGVNSFGFSGANAHVILAEPPPRPAPEPSPPRLRPLPLMVSARSESALGELTERFRRRLGHTPPEQFADFCYTASQRRGQHPHRAVVLAGSPAEAADRLAALGAGQPVPGAAVDTARLGSRVAFVFTGSGAQWAGMGADLFAADPAFRATVEAVDLFVRRRLGWWVAEELRAAPAASRLALAEVGQPTLFAVQLALVNCLAAWGIRPDAVVGHGIGEVAAAHVAGALDLDSAVRVVAECGRAQADTAGRGRMAAVGLSVAEAEEVLARYPGRLEIAAVNSDQDVTLVGHDAALAELGERLTARGVFFRRLDLNYPLHGRAMAPVERPLRAALAGLTPGRPAIPMASAVTGEMVTGASLDADYWWRNTRQPVLFDRAVRALAARGFDIFVEIGPHPILASYLRRTRTASGGPVAVVPTLRRGTGGPAAMLTSVAALLAAGAAMDWERHFPQPGRVVDLPAYPWQRERHWNGEPDWWGTAGDHPLLGERLEALDPLWRTPLEPARVPWLADHRIAGSVVVPAAACVEMALAAGWRALDAPVEVTDLDMPATVVVRCDDDALDVRLQTSVCDEDGVVRIASRTGTSPDWQVCARGRVRRLLARPPAALDVAAHRARLPHPLSGEQHYQHAARVGLAYGPAFQVLREVWWGREEALARYACTADAERYQAHPTVVDGAIQAVLPVLTALGGKPGLPVFVEQVRAWRRPAAEGYAHARVRSADEHQAVVDVTVTDENGVVAVELRGCRLRRYDQQAGAHPDSPVEQHVTVLRAAPRNRVPAADDGPVAPDLVRTCAARLGQLTAAWQRESRYAEFRTGLRGLVAHLVAQEIDWVLPDREPFGVGELVAVGLLPGYTRLVEALLPLVVEHGLASAAGRSRWRLVGEPDPQPRFAALLREFPNHTAELVLYQRCCRHLAEVCTGQRDPLTVLFPDTDGGHHPLEHFAEACAPLSLHHRLLAELVRTLVTAWPPDRSLRVLEVGAGTGGTTAVLLPLLPADKTQYVCTDVSETFLSWAAERFGDYDFVSYEWFDLDGDPAEQGFASDEFDLIIAGNAVHASQDVRACLTRLRGLLAPGGQLLAVESHDTALLAPVFGLTEDFWECADTALRPHSPLLGPAAWLELLRECGFTDVTRLGADEEPHRDQFSLLVARNPAEPADLPGLPPAEPGCCWIVAAEPAGEAALVTEVASLLAEAGSAETRRIWTSAEPDDWLEKIPAEASSANIVLVLGRTRLDGPAETVRLGAHRAMVVSAIAAACRRLRPGVRARLWLVTRPCGALPETTFGPERALAPEDAATWGVARSLANEQPELGVKRVSLHRTGSVTLDAWRITWELLDPDDEDELVLTGSGRFVPRVVPRQPDILDPAVFPNAGSLNYALAVRDRGPAYRLAWQETRSVAPGPDEVAIAVRAAGLNQRDVLHAEALDEGYAGATNRPGLECAGVVTEVGSEVTGFAPGDRVFALAPGSLAARVVAKAGLVGHLPEPLTFTDGATLPVAFAVVHHSLTRLARLTAEDVLLVHGAAGGIGLAAVQYAQHLGATVIATAGTEEKRELVRLLGVPHVLNSRSLSFAEEVLELTDGKGVDVVLNSLSGEAIPRGLELLRPHGRFIELSGHDMHTNQRLLLRPLRNNVALFGVALDQAIASGQADERGHAQFAEVVRQVQAGAYRPLPRRTLPATQVEEAFQLLRQGRHLGKVVVTLGEPTPIVRRGEPVVLDPAGAYLVVGGLGGLGAATAGWLADRGARTLALVSRRGMASPEAEVTVAALAGQGMRVTAHAADVTDPVAMRRVVEAIESGQAGDGPPCRVRGVVHAGMALDDDLLSELDDERFRTALAPKMGGGLVLDELTRDRDLDLFVVFSSATATIGHVRQSAYVAGNLFLEALVRARRQAGRPALAVAWSAIDEIGHLARERAVREALDQIGLPAMNPKEALAVLETGLRHKADALTVGRWRWEQLATFLPRLGTEPRTAHLVPEPEPEAEAEPEGESSAEPAPDAPAAAEPESAAGAGAAAASAGAGAGVATPGEADQEPAETAREA